MHDSKAPKDATLLAIAWPETWCKNAQSWYDPFLEYIGFSKNGFSPVGHAAFVLIHPKTGALEYYDCGRYDSPEGKALIRSSEFNKDLQIKVQPKLQNTYEPKLENLNEILEAVQNMPGNYSYGAMLHKEIAVNFAHTKAIISQEQEKGPQIYGPFHLKGTNCARFVLRVIRKSQNKSWLWQLRYFPSPLPSNLTGHQDLISMLGCHLRLKASACLRFPKNKTSVPNREKELIQI